MPNESVQDQADFRRSSACIERIGSTAAQEVHGLQLLIIPVKRHLWPSSPQGSGVCRLTLPRSRTSRKAFAAEAGSRRLWPGVPEVGRQLRCCAWTGHGAPEGLGPWQWQLAIPLRLAGPEVGTPSGNTSHIQAPCRPLWTFVLCLATLNSQLWRLLVTKAGFTAWLAGCHEWFAGHAPGVEACSLQDVDPDRGAASEVAA